jgi:ATP-dependent Clp protease ATP-binding subunit ClpA
MARVIQREIKDKLADELLFGTLKQGGRVKVGLAPDGLQLEIQCTAAEGKRVEVEEIA